MCFLKRILHIRIGILLPDSTGHPMDIRFRSILRPHVHGHEMDVHRTSDFGRLLMVNFWTSIGYSDLDVNRETRYYRSNMFHASFVTKYVCLHLDILKVFLLFTKFSKSARDVLLSLT